MKIKEPIYEEESRCKVCQSRNRTFIELLHYSSLHRNYREICEYINYAISQGGKWDFDNPLNEMNLSTHFRKHVNQEGFWQENPKLVPIQKMRFE